MRYEVIREWHGVSIGDIIETENLHEALKPNVRQIAQLTKPMPEAEPPRRGRPPKDKE